MRQTILIIAMVAGLAGCARIAESRLNPFNWFGGDRNIAVTVPASGISTDPRPFVDQVVSMSIERTADGAILRATGLPPRQGYWDAELLQEPRDGAVLSYQFRLMPPPAATRVSTPPSREVVVATFISDQALAGVREIRVLGTRSSRSVRR